MPETIAFIGLGVMGKPMARNLLRAGYGLRVHSRGQGPVEEIGRLGAERAASPAQAAAGADVVITMLPDTPDVVSVMRGERGVLAGASDGALIIDMSSISPIETRQLAEEARARGLAYLDAPVSGGQAGAENATLSIMVGGEESAFERALPIFQVLGKNIVHVGASGSGQICKACNQMVVAITIDAVGEALVLARKAGVDPGRVRQALLGGFAGSRILELHGARMLERQFGPGFRARLHAKDLSIALAAARQYGAFLPATAIVSQMLEAMIAAGDGDLDHAALAALIERLSGVPPGDG